MLVPRAPQSALKRLTRRRLASFASCEALCRSSAQHVRVGAVTRRGWLLFAAMGLIWGIPYLLIKVAVGELQPASLVFVRTAAGALILVPISLSRVGLQPLVRHWRAIAIYTAIEIGIPWFLLSHAELKLSSSLSGLLLASVPLIGALLALVMRTDDRMQWRQVTGLFLGLAGVAALLGVDVSRGDLGAVGEIAIVATCYAVGPMIIARRLSDIPALGVVTASLVLAALAYTPIGILQLPRFMPSGQVIASVAGLAIVCTALAFLVFFALIAEVGPIRATVITYVNPAVALVVGIALLHERFTVGTGVGFALIIAGSYVATRRRHPPADTRARFSTESIEEPAPAPAAP